jgi:hypothetical protein
MDNQFTTLSRSYHDNYIEYAVTGNDTYKTAYMSAQQGIDTIISSLQGEVSDQQSSISNFYNSGVEGKIRDARASAKNARADAVTQGDKLVASEMRNIETSSLPASLPDLSPYYITLTVLILVNVLLKTL